MVCISIVPVSLFEWGIKTTATQWYGEALPFVQAQSVWASCPWLYYLQRTWGEATLSLCPLVLWFFFVFISLLHVSMRQSECLGACLLILIQATGKSLIHSICCFSPKWIRWHSVKLVRTRTTGASPLEGPPALGKVLQQSYSHWKMKWVVLSRHLSFFRCVF